MLKALTHNESNESMSNESHAMYSTNYYNKLSEAAVATVRKAENKALHSP